MDRSLGPPGQKCPHLPNKPVGPHVSVEPQRVCISIRYRGSVKNFKLDDSTYIYFLLSLNKMVTRVLLKSNQPTVQLPKTPPTHFLSHPCRSLPPGPLLTEKLFSGTAHGRSCKQVLSQSYSAGSGWEVQKDHTGWASSSQQDPFTLFPIRRE